MSEEIDVVVTRTIDGGRYGWFAEYRYENTPSGGTELKTLIHRMAPVKGYDVKIPVMYSESGYDQSLEGAGDVELYTLDDVLGTIERRGRRNPDA